MAKAKTGATKVKAPAKKPKAGTLSKASKKTDSAVPRLAKAAAKPAAKVAPKPVGKGADKVPAKTADKPPAKGADKPALKAAPPPEAAKGAAKGKAGEKASKVPPKPKVPAKLPPMGQPLTTREMEQLLTAGTGRGVEGEGSLKGRLSAKDGVPTLNVVGRDKRELTFVLQGPSQDELADYADFKVSVSGFIRKTTNYSGTVDVRKYAAKKVEVEVPAEPVKAEEKLKYLSPGEVEQICSAGMGAGMRGFAAVRGTLEMTGEDFFLVLSNGGTRQQVSFMLEGKNAKGLRKLLGQTVLATGTLEKESGWGGKLQLETCEPRPSEFRAISRDGMEVVEVDGSVTHEQPIDVKLNHGLVLRLQEKAGFTWAVEPTTAKRVGLREANFEPHSNGPPTREFFFTPRNPGSFDVEFFLAKVFNPLQVSKTYKLPITVKL